MKMKNAVDWEKASGIYLTHCTDYFVVQRGSEIKDIKILKCFHSGKHSNNNLIGLVTAHNFAERLFIE